MNDIDFLQQQLSPESQELAKAIAAAAGFVGYNLEPEAALLLPYFAGWRSRVPTDPAAQGATQSTWKVQLGYGSVDQSAWGTAEASIGPATTPTATQFQAPYLQQSFTGDVTYISMLMSRGFDDPLNVEVSNVLSLLLKLEEYICLSGNNVAISIPVPVVTASTLQSAATFAAGTWHIKATAITNQGAVSNASANSTVGETAASASISVVVPSGGSDFLEIDIPIIPGAAGYKIYAERTAGGGTFYLCNPATTLRYRKAAGTPPVTDLTALGDKIVVPTGQTYVGVNYVQLYAIPPNTQPVAPTVDASANALTFEGLLSWTQKTTIYGVSVGAHPNVDMQGMPFTTLGTGILEIDNVLESLWTIFNISPTLFLGSPKTVRAMGNAIIKTSVVPTYQVQIGQERGAFTGGIYLGGYTNKFVATMLPGQNPNIPVWAHPYLPDGTLLIPSEDIPSATYRYSRKGKAFSLEVLAPYTYWELARTDLSVPFSILWSQTLKCHHPQAQAAIQGIRVDQ